MKPIIDIGKSIKKAMLERRLKEVEGNIKYWSKIIGTWEKQMDALEEKRLTNYYKLSEYSKLKGQITYRKNMIVLWQNSSKLLRNKLSELGESL